MLARGAVDRGKRIGIAAAAVAATLFAAPRPARACGPDFQIELLSRRATTLAELEDGIFVDEAEHLVPSPARRYLVMAGTDGVVDPAHESAAERALYRLGADAWNADDVATAERAFQQLLALPPAARQARSTYAAYMLARIRTWRDDDGASAIAAYRQVRALADAGFRDDGGLAASSLGQEARLHASQLDAVRLYAEQAAHGHPDGGTSLLFVARAIIDRGDAHILLDDVVGQRLLAAYLYARSDELDEAQLARIWREVLARAGADRPVALAGADRFAAAAYRRGDFATARSLLDASSAMAVDAADRDTSLARRVRAKLALRDGDTATAAALLASIDTGDTAATGATGATGPTGATAASPRVCGDRTVLATAAGDFTLAMDRAWAMRARYTDALYLAERVLTIDELRAFVDRLPPPDNVASDGRWGIDTTTMRGLLARRLVRDGRIADAVPYFAPRERRHALDYAGALERARTTTDDLTRAEALFTASRIARRHGLEIMGTAHAPDWEHYYADYDLSEYTSTEDPGALFTAAEDARVAASAPDSTRRYHYRHVAADLAAEAIDFLPRQSQARASVMCWSARHVRYRDPQRLEDLYHRYLREGPFAGHESDFGIECSEPDFAAARASLPLGPAPAWQLVLTAILCALGAAYVFHRMWPRVTPRP
ncbi:MAG TPA: hypothetical protein VM261_19130 [Kofleriaceae bacterium]|nr:hypothetical protein [Kofleriaceae bacterium]